MKNNFRIVDSATQFGLACVQLSCVELLPLERGKKRDKPEEFPIAEAELPDNITDFKAIEIRFILL
jgi:hypothetical protein